ncbi:MAG: hypothetical protein WDN28_13080 [Chthoniobacter sp.]
MAKHTLKKRKGPRFSPQFIKRLSSWLVLSTVLTIAVRSASNLYWDGANQADTNNANTGGGLGGDGTWDASSENWWDGSSAGDSAWSNGATAVFTGTPGTVDLQDTTLNATGLQFNAAGFTLKSSNNSTLLLNGSGYGPDSSSPVGLTALTGIGGGGQTAPTTISAGIQLGSSQNWNVGTLGTFGYLVQSGVVSDGGNRFGLSKGGRGTLVLGSPNTFTGQVGITSGVLVATSAASLGGGGTIYVSGNATNGGGELMLANGSVNGFTLNRDLLLNGVGQAIAQTSQGNPQGFIFSQGALASVGNNTINGNITSGNFVTTRIVSDFGTLTLNGTLTLGTGISTQFGSSSGNTAQNNNIVINSKISGTTGTLEKVGNGTVVLTNTANDFAGIVQVTGGLLRIDNVAELGTSTATNSIQFAGTSTLDIRDADGASFANKSINISGNGTTATLFLDNAIGGAPVINELFTFKAFGSTTNNINMVFTSRNGFGAQIGGGTSTTVALSASNNAGNVTITDTMNGALILDSNLSYTDGSSARNVGLAVTGDMTVTGNLLATGTLDPQWVKTGTGTLTIGGTASTIIGSYFAQGGVTAIHGIGALLGAGSHGGINLSSGTTVGAISYLGAVGTGAGETSAKVFELDGTTASSIIFANQTGTAPTALTLTSNISADQTGAKTLILGGTADSSLVNKMSGVINDWTGTTPTATSLTKIGSDTWMYSPAAANYTSQFTKSSGAASANTNVIAMADTSGIVLGQTVSGSGVPVAVVTAINPGVSITISRNIGSTIASGTTLTFGAVSGFTGNVTVAGGTMQFQPTANTGNGSNLIADTASVIFAADAATGNGYAGGIFEYQGTAATGAVTEKINALTPTAGAGTVAVTNAGGGTPTLLFNTLGTRGTGATLKFAPAAGTSIQFGAAVGANGILKAIHTLPTWMARWIGSRRRSPILRSRPSPAIRPSMPAPPPRR